MNDPRIITYRIDNPSLRDPYASSISPQRMWAYIKEQPWVCIAVGIDCSGLLYFKLQNTVGLFTETVMLTPGDPEETAILFSKKGTTEKYIAFHQSELPTDSPYVKTFENNLPAEIKLLLEIK